MTRLGSVLAAAVLAVATTVLPGLSVAPAEAVACSDAGGVTVVVDPGSLPGSRSQTCVGGSGKAAGLFGSAGHTLTRVQRFPGAVCKVDGEPDDSGCVNMPPTNAYWGRAGLDRAIVDALSAAGKDIAALSIDDLAPADQFHGGGKPATQRLARLAGLRPGLRVLDVGGGLGGPARTLAVEFGCTVTIVDLTESYVNAGRALTALLDVEGAGPTPRLQAVSSLAVPPPDPVELQREREGEEEEEEEEASASADSRADDAGGALEEKPDDENGTEAEAPKRRR